MEQDGIFHSYRKESGKLWNKFSESLILIAPYQAIPIGFPRVGMNRIGKSVGTHHKHTTKRFSNRSDPLGRLLESAHFGENSFL